MTNVCTAYVIVCHEINGHSLIPFWRTKIDLKGRTVTLFHLSLLNCAAHAYSNRPDPNTAASFSPPLDSSTDKHCKRHMWSPAAKKQSGWTGMCLAIRFHRTISRASQQIGTRNEKGRIDDGFKKILNNSTQRWNDVKVLHTLPKWCKYTIHDYQPLHHDCILATWVNWTPRTEAKFYWTDQNDVRLLEGGNFRNDQKYGCFYCLR